MMRLGNRSQKRNCGDPSECIVGHPAAGGGRDVFPAFPVAMQTRYTKDNRQSVVLIQLSPIEILNRVRISPSMEKLEFSQIPIHLLSQS